MKAKIAIALLLSLGVLRTLFGLQGAERHQMPPRESVSSEIEAGKRDSLLVMFWNLENFFDWHDDSLSSSSSDSEFSSFGKRHWTKKKFYVKCNAIAKALFWIQDQKGFLPDVIGFAEIENKFVLSRLINSTPLREAGYSIVHFESPDPRGIDVALLYRLSRLKYLDAKPLPVVNRDPYGPSLLTRDILLTEFMTNGGDSLAIFVNHHPSKYGNDSQWRREAALHRLRSASDSLQSEGFRNILAMGDFNDTPENSAFEILTGVAGGASRGLTSEAFAGNDPLVNMSSLLAAKGEGTIRYSGKWELIDMFFASPSIAAKAGPRGVEVVQIPFLMVRDNTHSGEKPFRAYAGPRYIGGVSDHCPIVLEIQ